MASLAILSEEQKHVLYCAVNNYNHIPLPPTLGPSMNTSATQSVLDEIHLLNEGIIEASGSGSFIGSIGGDIRDYRFFFVRNNDSDVYKIVTNLQVTVVREITPFF